jgi:hypothetical protein
LTFSANFDKDAHWKLLKEMIIQVFWFLFPTLEATFICVLSYNAWLYHQILHSVKDNREISFQNIFQWQSLPGNMVNKYDWYSSIYNFCNIQVLLSHLMALFITVWWERWPFWTFLFLVLCRIRYIHKATFLAQDVVIFAF